MDYNRGGPSWRMRALSRVGYIGVVQADFTTQTVRGDPGVGRVFGVRPEQMLEGITIDRFDRAFLDEDRELIRRHRRAVTRQEGQTRLEYRLRNALGGGVTWIRSLVHFETDRNGRLSRASGALFDTTAFPPVAPGVHLSSDATEMAEEAGRPLPLGELDRLLGQLVRACRTARALGLSRTEDDLRQMLARVGTMLSDRLRATNSH